MDKDVVARNLKDTGSYTKVQIVCMGIRGTPGRYESILLFGAPDENAAMKRVRKRADRIDIGRLLAGPGDATSRPGPAGGSGTGYFLFSQSPADFNVGERIT